MEGSLRVALVSREFPPGLGSGGIGTYTQKTARALARLGQEVHVLTEATAGERRGRDEIEDGVHIHRLAAVAARPDERRVVTRAWAVAQCLKGLGPFDVVQACEWDAEAVAYAPRHRGLLVTRLATPFYLVDRLNGVTPRSRVRTAIVGRLERMQAALSDIVISPSLALARVVARDWGLALDRMAVIPTGIEMPVIDPSHPAPAAVGDRPYVLYFGRLERRKGVKTWIDALPSVLERNPQLRALFVGQDLGDGARPWSEYARRALGGLASRLVFIPRLPHADLFPVIAKADVVVMPSHWESMANACLEAMALARPVVATGGSGFAEVIRDGVNGILVRPEDEAALAGAVNGLLADRPWAERIGRAAARRAAEYDLDAMARRLLYMYRELSRGPAVAALPQVTG